jgi:hypothetical protein
MPKMIRWCCESYVHVHACSHVKEIPHAPSRCCNPTGGTRTNPCKRHRRALRHSSSYRSGVHRVSPSFHPHNACRSNRVLCEDAWSGGSEGTLLDPCISLAQPRNGPCLTRVATPLTRPHISSPSLTSIVLVCCSHTHTPVIRLTRSALPTALYA